MLKLVVGLYECNPDGTLIKAEPILQHESMPKRSVEEAYEFFDYQMLFDIFLQVDESIINATGQSMVASQKKEPDFEQERGISVPVETNPSRE